MANIALNPRASAADALSAVHGLRDNALLAKIARNNYIIKSVRVAATERLTDQKTLAEMAGRVIDPSRNGYGEYAKVLEFLLSPNSPNANELAIAINITETTVKATAQRRLKELQEINDSKRK